MDLDLNSSFQSIAAHAIARAETHPTSPAFILVLDDRSLNATWRDVAGWAYSVIDFLDRFDLAPGSHIASVLPNSIEWIAIDLACQLLGMVHVAIDSRLPVVPAALQVIHSESQICFSKERLRESLQSLVPSHIRCLTLQCVAPGEKRGNADWSFDYLAATNSQEVQSRFVKMKSTEPDRPAMLIYTSGTTGRGQGVVLSHNNLLCNALAKLDAAPQSPNDVRLNILPFSHAYARTCELTSWILSGGTLSIAGNWTEFLNFAPSVRPTLVNLVPHLVTKLVQQFPAGASAEEVHCRARQLLGNRIRLLQVGGAALPNELWHQLSLAGLPPLQGYGLTETSPVVCSNRAGFQQPGSVGPPVHGVEVCIDQDAVLWTRGPHVMLGYWRDEAATQNRIKDGWLNSGDLAERLPNGHYRILGRLADQIVLSTGYKVSPQGIEELLMRDEWIERAVVIGMNAPHVSALVWPSWDAVPSHLRTSATLKPLLVERFRRSLSEFPRYAIPEQVDIIEGEFPNDCLTNKGSLRRQKLLDSLSLRNLS